MLPEVPVWSAVLAVDLIATYRLVFTAMIPGARMRWVFFASAFAVFLINLAPLFMTRIEIHHAAAVIGVVLVATQSKDLVLRKEASAQPEPSA